MCICISIAFLRAASRSRRNTSGPNTAGSVTEPSARLRPRRATPLRRVVRCRLAAQSNNRRCWNCPNSRSRICIHTHTRHPHPSHLPRAVLDLPPLQMPEEGDSVSYWHSCPKAGSRDGLHFSSSISRRSSLPMRLRLALLLQVLDPSRLPCLLHHRLNRQRHRRPQVAVRGKGRADPPILASAVPLNQHSITCMMPH